MEIATLIILLRLIAPLLILRHPLSGVVIASLLDYIDFNFLGSLSFYQPLDKALDLYYLTLCLYVALSWRDIWLRRWLIGLYLWRVIGVFLLLATQLEWVLLVFANVFEVAFIFAAVYRRLTGSERLFATTSDILLISLGLTLPKLTQEYVLHIAPLYPHLLPPAFTAALHLPQLFGAALWLFLPLLTLGYAINTHQKLQQHAKPTPDYILKEK